MRFIATITSPIPTTTATAPAPAQNGCPVMKLPGKMLMPWSSQIVPSRSSRIPMDHESIARTVVNTRKVLVLHEANKTMGIGAEIAAFIAEELFMELDGPIVRVAGDDCHLPYNGPEEDAIIPNPAKVIEAARRLAAF